MASALRSIARETARRSFGSFHGSRWVLTPEPGGTDVLLDWNPVVEKPIVKRLSPILKPLFEWNHHWAMNLGEKQLTEYIRRRH